MTGKCPSPSHLTESSWSTKCSTVGWWAVWPSFQVLCGEEGNLIVDCQNPWGWEANTVTFEKLPPSLPSHPFPPSNPSHELGQLCLETYPVGCPKPHCTLPLPLRTCLWAPSHNSPISLLPCQPCPFQLLWPQLWPHRPEQLAFPPAQVPFNPNDNDKIMCEILISGNICCFTDLHPLC